jgi:hypothetical protein
MDAVTYPNLTVAKYVNDNVVPLRIGNEEQPYAGEFKVKWTPRLFVLDPGGSSHHDALGFFPPDEMVPFLKLGQAKHSFNNDQLDEAAETLDHLLLESSGSGSAPEAVFLRGVARFKKTHEKAYLKDVYRILKFDYPASMWAQRGFPYWNL